jgi:phosphate-selective porin OprO/OprP
LAGAFVAILSTGANAQLVQPSGGGGQLAAEPPIARLSQADRRLDAQPVGGQQTAADLAARVAALEKALQKAADKEAENKRKAAAKPSVTVGGRVFLDSVWFNDNAAAAAAAPAGYGSANLQDTVYFRTARLHAEGEMFDVYSYKIELDFADRELLSETARQQRTAFKDVYFQIRDLRLLNTVRVGHFREPFSLEELTSTLSITFMERSLPNALAPARNVGAMALNHNEQETLTWAFGGFRHMDTESVPLGSNDDGGYSFTARGTWLPWYDEASGGRGLVHLGLGYRYWDFDDLQPRFRSRPENGVGPTILDTGRIDAADFGNFLGPEVAIVFGPFSVQSEYVAGFLSQSGAEDAFVSGYYIYASYFLTGEHRPYRRSEGRFGRTKPLGNFLGIRSGDGDSRSGRGAWELAYRYSNLDLTDPGAGLGAGFAADHTFGVNWYLTPNARLMWNYVHTDVRQRFTPAGTPLPNVPLDAFLIRMQFDF